MWYYPASKKNIYRGRMRKAESFLTLVFIIIFGFILSSCTRNVPDNISQIQTTEIHSEKNQTPQNNVLATLQETETLKVTQSNSVTYNLSIYVLRPENEPIEGARVKIKNEKDQIVDEKYTDVNGTVFWEGITDDAKKYTVNADGYLVSNGTLSFYDEQLDEEVVMTIDPFSLSASLACRPEEVLLYKEDFQDGNAEGWGPIEQLSNGWEIFDHPDEPGNSILFVNSTSELGGYLEGEKFGDMVWRLKFQVGDPFEGRLAFKWMCEDGMCYQFEIQYDRLSEPLSRFDHNDILLLSDPKLPPPVENQWHLLELSSYQGLVWVFLDDEEYTTYLDIEPLLQGTIGLEISPFGGRVFLDDFSVCELNSPLIPLHMELPSEE